MCSQKVRVALLQPDGIATLCERVSVCVLPTPFSQAKLVPPWALCPERLVITVVDDWVQGEVPLSKPPLVTTWAGVQSAASGAAGGAAAAGVTGSRVAANAMTPSAPAAKALWGVGLTRNSFEAAGIAACSVAALTAWVRRGRPRAARIAHAIAGVRFFVASPWGQGDGCGKPGRFDQSMPSGAGKSVHRGSPTYIDLKCSDSAISGPGTRRAGRAAERRRPGPGRTAGRPHRRTAGTGTGRTARPVPRCGPVRRVRWRR